MTDPQQSPNARPAGSVGPRRHGGDSVLRAVFYMLIASMLFPILNASVKYLGRHYPMPEIFWARYAGHVVFCLIAFLPRYGRALFSTRRPSVQVVRSVLLFGASASYFLGLKTIDMSTATAITFVGPILVTALSVPMLAERVGPRRWAAVMCGFVGAVIIIRPGFQVVQWGAILVLLDTVFYSIYQILSRKVGSVDPAYTSITLAGIGGLILASFIMPFSTVELPTSLFDLVLFVLIGLWGLLGHFFVIKAVQWGPASLVAPVGYFELVGSTLLGWLLFSGLPDALTWVGAAVIVASGLYITYREHKLQRMRREAGQA